MIDLGRKRDMEMLMSVVNDPLQTVSHRRKAYRTMQSIKRKMNDQVILKLRLRLIAANIANNADEVEKLSDRITAYERKHYLNRKY